jgi:hypothetical protein
MCEALRRSGLVAGKAWHFPAQKAYRIESRNHPNGVLDWRFHVAPVLRISDSEQLYVFDPGLFLGPVVIAEWHDAQSRGATTPITPSDVYMLTDFGPSFDGDFSKTRTELARCAGLLRSRITELQVKPPYQPATGYRRP